MLAERCSLCFCEVEDLNHLFLYCSFTQKLWTYFLQSGGFAIPSRATPLSLLFDWKDKPSFSSRGRLLWKHLAHAIFWCVWKERNCRVFDEVLEPVEKLIQQVKSYLWSWVRGEPIMKDTRLEDVIFEWETVIVS